MVCGLTLALLMRCIVEPHSLFDLLLESINSFSAHINPDVVNCLDRNRSIDYSPQSVDVS